MLMMESRSRGVLDTPPARGMTALCGAAPSPSLRGAERRSNPFSFFAQRDGLLRSARNDGSTVGCLKIESKLNRPARSLPRPGRLALFAERLEALLGVFRHRQKCDLAFGIGDALVERHRGDRAHGVFAAPDRGRRFVDDAADQPFDLGVEFD